MKKLLLPFLASFILFAWGCDRIAKKHEAKPTTDAAHKTLVARVNGRPIYEEDLRGRPLESIIDTEILYDSGMKKGLDKEVEVSVEEYKKRLIVAAVQREILQNLPKGEEVTDAEIQDYYKANKSNYQAMSFKQIIVSDQNLADQIQKRVAAGEDVDKIATELTNAGTTINVRDLRFNRRYNDLFAGEPVGSVSAVLKEGNNFVILKLTEIKEIPLDKARQSIKYTVATKRRAQAIHDYAEKVKKDNKITVEILKAGEGKGQ